MIDIEKMRSLACGAERLNTLFLRERLMEAYDEIERLHAALAPFAKASQRGLCVLSELKGSTVLNHVEIYGLAVDAASNGTSFANWALAYEVIEQSSVKREGESE